MEDLNNVPSTGTFGNSIGQVNQNFGLVKGAIENLEGRTIRSKGLFPTQAALTAAYPSPKVGDYAYVGSGLPATIYDCLVEGTWHNTGQTGGSETVDLSNYSTKSETSASLAQATARTGYGEATASNNAYSVTIANYTLPTNGGVVRVKMPTAATGAATLDITETGAKTLWYNGKAVSSDNTWETGEIISVFYDGTKYMSSNSQGGGGDAEKIKYNNSQSGLSAGNVQLAIDEINVNVTQKPSIKSDESDNIFSIVDSVNEGAAYFGTCEIDVTQYNGKTIFVDSSCSASAYNLFVDVQGNVLDSWQQASTTTVKKVIPQNASKLLLTNAFYSNSGTTVNDPSVYFNDALSYILENFGSLSQEEIGIFANEDKSENILNICDTNGNILAYFDKNGEFHANIANIDQDEFKMYLPDTINSYVGDTLQLFKYPMTLLGDYSNYGINLSVNTSNNNIRKYGKDLRRYFEFIPLATGTYNIDANVLDTRQMIVLVEKAMTINVLTPTNPSSVKNILCIGDSETEGVINNSGVTASDGSTSSTRFSWVNEIKARMTTSRTATQTLPAGLGLSNIHFIGTRNTTNGRHEGYGGWDGADFMKSGSPFYINGAVDFNAYLAKDNVYDDTSHKGVDIIYITLGANTTKTLTVSGRKLILSATEHKTQIISMLNAINTQLRTDSSKAYYNPNLKVVLLNYVFSWIDGYGYHPYGSGRYNDNCWTSQGYIACFNANNEIAAMDEYKNWVDSILIAPQVDSEYAYCYINKQKNVYMADTEINHLEAVHPNELGYRMFGAAVMRDLLGRI